MNERELEQEARRLQQLNSKLEEQVAFLSHELTFYKRTHRSLGWALNNALSLLRKKQLEDKEFSLTKEVVYLAE